MTLQELETFVLVNIGHKRYHLLSAASATTNTGRDFALLHRCIYLAREEIKLNTLIPSLLKRSSGNVTVASQKAYSLPTDFDVPVKVRYRADDDEWELDRVYPNNLLQKLGDSLTTSIGTPGLYMIFGNSLNVAQIELYVIPEDAGELFDVEYKPILSNLILAADEDLIMQKYPQTVIKLATAFAFNLIKKNQTQFDRWYLLGAADFAKIDFREVDADSKYKELPNELLRKRRKTRFTQ